MKLLQDIAKTFYDLYKKLVVGEKLQIRRHSQVGGLHLKIHSRIYCKWQQQPLFALLSV